MNSIMHNKKIFIQKLSQKNSNFIPLFLLSFFPWRYFFFMFGNEIKLKIYSFKPLSLLSSSLFTPTFVIFLLLIH